MIKEAGVAPTDCSRAVCRAPRYDTD
eukprot:COSAG02_NODE_36944_length_448_cov_1.160458_1_plen_25_part_10